MLNIITAVKDGKAKKINYETMWDYLTTGFYEYKGYDKEYKAQKYILKEPRAINYPTEIYDHTLMRRL